MGVMGKIQNNHIGFLISTAEIRLHNCLWATFFNLTIQKQLDCA